MSNVVTILAADPGTANFGYCVLQANLELGRPPKNIKVLQYGKINSTLRTLTGVATGEAEKYSAAIDYLLGKFDVDFCIMERFQTRGIGGPTIELVSCMIGIATAKMLALGRPLKAVIASQWKSAAARSSIDLEKIYENHKALKVSPHEVDSYFIGLYGLELLSKDKPYNQVFSRLNSKILLTSNNQVMIGERLKKPSKKRRA